MENKEYTIDELLLRSGITHLSGKQHDGIIAAFNEYAGYFTSELQELRQKELIGAKHMIQARIDENVALQLKYDELNEKYLVATNTISKIRYALNNPLD